DRLLVPWGSCQPLWSSVALLCGVGGACARRRVLCARAPMLTLELDRVGLPGRRHDGRWVSCRWVAAARSFWACPVPGRGRRRELAGVHRLIGGVPEA